MAAILSAILIAIAVRRREIARIEILHEI